MLFAIIFKDKPHQAELRIKYLNEHILWLEENRNTIPIGGSLRNELGQNPIGGLWIARADTEQELHALIQTDPFYLNGLRESYEIHFWSKSNSERMVEL